MRLRTRLATLAQRTGSTAPVAYTISTAVPRLGTATAISTPRPNRHQNVARMTTRRASAARRCLLLKDLRKDMGAVSRVVRGGPLPPMRADIRGIDGSLQVTDRSLGGFAVDEFSFCSYIGIVSSASAPAT